MTPSLGIRSSPWGLRVRQRRSTCCRRRRCFIDTTADITGQHYAFLVSDDVFDSLIAKIRERGIEHWADPRGQHRNEINTHDGGRGVYFQDPSGHYMEALTVPYGGW